MSFLILILAGTGFLAVATTVIFAAIVIGIRRGDRGRLANPARSNSDALARRILVGIRHPGGNEKDGAQ